MTQRLQPKFPPKAPAFHMAEVTLAPETSRQTIEELSNRLPGGVQVALVRKGSQNVIPSDDIEVDSGDALMLVADRRETIEQAAKEIGSLQPGHIVQDRAGL